MRQQRRDADAGAVLPGESLEQENRRLRRENAVLRQEQAFAKKWRCTSRRSRVEVRRDDPPSRRVHRPTDVPRARGLSFGLLRVAETPAELARPD